MDNYTMNIFYMNNRFTGVHFKPMRIYEKDGKYLFSTADLISALSTYLVKHINKIRDNVDYIDYGTGVVTVITREQLIEIMEMYSEDPDIPHDDEDVNTLIYILTKYLKDVDKIAEKNCMKHYKILDTKGNYCSVKVVFGDLNNIKCLSDYELKENK